MAPRPNRLLGLVLTVFAGGAATAQPLDEARSELLVLVWKQGLGAGFAHDHVVRAARLSGTMASDGGVVLPQVEVAVAGLIADEPTLRSRLRVGDPLKEADIAAVEARMKSDEQLDAARFPTIRFVATSSTVPSSGGKGTIEGAFTLHGVTRPLTFAASSERKDGGLEATAKVRFKTSDYGVTPFRGPLGLVGNRDEVELRVRLFRVDPPSSP